MTRHLHRDYGNAFCGKDASHILMTFVEAESDCAACIKALRKHEHDTAAAKEKEEAERARVEAEFHEAQAERKRLEDEEKEARARQENERLQLMDEMRTLRDELKARMRA